MLHPRGDLLADIAALFEIDPVELVEAVFQQQRLLGHQVPPPVGYAIGDAERVVIRARRFFDAGAPQRRFAARADHPRAERRGARIGEDFGALNAARLRLRAVAEQRMDRVGQRGIDRHVGAQLVHRQPLRQRRTRIRLAVEAERGVPPEDQEVEEILALGGQQGGVDRRAGVQPADVVGDQPLEEAARVAARDRQDGPIVEPDIARHRLSPFHAPVMW